MGFDYEKAIENVISLQTFRNADGTAMTVSILNGLKHCPFISVVADINKISEEYLYTLLKYYIGDVMSAQMLEDVGERRRQKVSDLKEKEKELLKSILGL